MKPRNKRKAIMGAGSSLFRRGVEMAVPLATGPAGTTASSPPVLVGEGNLPVPAPPAAPLATEPGTSTAPPPPMIVGEGGHLVPAPPAEPLATEPEPGTTAPPPPVLSGDGHLLLEFPLGHPWDSKQPGLIDGGNVVFRNEEKPVVQRIPRGFRGLGAYPKGALVREQVQFSAKLAMMDRLNAVQSIGVVREPTAAEGEEDEVCSFCQEPLGSRRLRVLPCSHAVHKNCFDYSVLREEGGDARRCPICRAIV